MKRIYTLLGAAVLAGAALTVACTPETTDTMTSLPITAAPFNGGSKAYVNDNRMPCWENGDAIHLTRINGEETTEYPGSVAVNYSSTSTPTAAATANGFSTSVGDKVFAGYPGSFFGSGISESMNITMPSSYTYSVAQGRQKIESPMLGKIASIVEVPEGGTNPNVMKLSNLCTLLDIAVSATGSPVIVDRIVVENTTTSARTPLSGAAHVDFSGATPTLSMTGSSDNNQIELVCPNGDQVAINATKHFYVPIPPLASNQKIEINVHNSLTGSWFKKTFNTSSSVAGNCIARLDTMLINDQAEAEYTFYDYIENTNNTSYINLGVIPNNNMKMEMTFKVTANMFQSQYYSGARNGESTTSTLYFGFSASYREPQDFRAYFNCANTSDSSQFTCTGSEMLRKQNVKYRHSLEILPYGSGKYYGRATFERFNNAGAVDAIITKNTGAYTGGISGANAPIYVFALGASKQPAGMRLYSYRIWQNGNLLYNFIPAVRNSDGTVGVYNMAADDGDASFIVPEGNFVVGND